MKKTTYPLLKISKISKIIARSMQVDGKRNIGLIGPLGAGKTTLVRHLAESLGIGGQVSSPTFTIMQKYQNGDKSLLHIDLYRIDPADKNAVGEIIEAISQSDYSVVEWVDRSPEIKEKMDMVLNLSHGGNEQERNIEEIK